MDTLIEWTCDHCGGRVRGSQGYLHVSKVEVGLFEIAHEEWERKLMEVALAQGKIFSHEAGLEDLGEEGVQFLMLTPEMLEGAPHPELVPWRVHHRKCDPEVDSDDYFILIEEIPTYKKLLRASLHIMGAPWISDTNWHDFVMALTEGH